MTDKPTLLSRNDELEKAINELCLAESVIGMTAGQIPERLINRRDAAIQRLRDLYVVSEKGPSADTERLDWLHGALFDKHWDGTIGRPCTWRMCGPYRHVLVKMVGNTFREAIDAARKENGNG